MKDLGIENEDVDYLIDKLTKPVNNKVKEKILSKTNKILLELKENNKELVVVPKIIIKSEKRPSKIIKKEKNPISTDLEILEDELDGMIEQYSRYTEKNPMLGIGYDKVNQKYKLQYKKKLSRSKNVAPLAEKMIEMIENEYENQIKIDLNLLKNYSNKLVSYKYQDIELFDIQHIFALLNIERRDIKYNEFKDRIEYYGFKQNRYGGYIVKELIILDVIKEILLRSRRSAREMFAKLLNINILNDIFLYKEEKYIGQIIRAFRGEKMKEQYYVDSYRIDLYFTEYRIAVECDEHGHRDRDPLYEQERERFLRQKIDCTFVRFNPDDKEFDIFETINEIHQNIKQNLLKKN